MSASEQDRLWFEHAVLAVLPELMATGRRLTRATADTEELVAETIARAWFNLGTLKQRDLFRGWICRILTNTFLSERRTQTRHPEEDLESADFSLFEKLHQPFLLWWSSPEQAFLDKLLRDDIARAIDSLPDVYRITVVLCCVQGFAYQEVSDMLGIPVGTVRSRLARGRSILQRALSMHAHDAGISTVNRENPTP